MKKQTLIAGALCLAVVALAGCKKTEKTAEVAEEVQVEEVAEPQQAPANKYGAAFFNDESKKSDVATDSTYAVTPSGLKYVMVAKGTGAAPKATDNVTVNYTGTHLNGQVFDSSYNHGEPITFPLNGVIPGWTEGLQLMNEGGKAVFYIPSALAYGEMGTPGGPIAPNEDLIFEVELLGVTVNP